MRAGSRSEPGFLSRRFPERTLHLRDAANGVRVFVLTPRLQVRLLALALLLGAWTVTATGLSALSALDDLGGRAETVAALERRIAALEAERRSAALRAEAALAALERRHDADAAALVERRALRARIAALGAEARSGEALRRDAEARLAQAEARIRAAEAARDGLERERDELADTLDRIALALKATAAARDDAIATAREVEGALGALEADAELERDRRARLLAEIEAAAELTLGGLEGMLATAGVDVEAVLERLRREYSGRGGPFVAAAETVAPLEPTERARALDVIQDLERANLMRIAATRMPFGRPVTGARLTSAFGPRRDPINGRRGFHEGLDFAGPRGMAIRAPAAGVVAYAGWMRGYGRVVKIRHDFGFETVYAHLSRARVREGQAVARGDRIGDMGNTGRSTGTHLHYEVRINEKPVNPMKFIEAARHVL